MRDGAFHSAHELATLPGLGQNEWYLCLSQLLELGYTFRRRDNSLAINLERRPAIRDAGDLLSKLLAGIDATKSDFGGLPNLDAQEPATDTTVDVGEQEFVNPEGDAIPRPAALDALMVSEDSNCFLPARVMVTATRAILARKSSGKTYLAMVIAEEFLRLATDTGVPFPFVVIDPTGVWYGLCATAHGTPSPHRILRLGGEYGDWPLAPNQGTVVAELVVSLWPNPVILDISDMLPEEQHQFAADFGAKFYTICHKPTHLFIDEADDFAPQSVESGNKVQRRCLGVFDRIVRRGRVKGIGVTLITQRPAVISKNVLSQVDGIYVLSVSAPHDLEAVDSWMRPAVSASDRDLCLKSLPSLTRGEVFLVQANLKAGALVKFTTRAKRTFDSSRTPTVDDPEPDPPTLSKVDEEIWSKAGNKLGHSISISDDDGSGDDGSGDDDGVPFDDVGEGGDGTGS
jgi:DNA helicase HerA-like ATPase